MSPLPHFTDMLTRGFEYAYKYGEPRNVNPKRYRMTPKCCQVKTKHHPPYV